MSLHRNKVFSMCHKKESYDESVPSNIAIS